jgi:hypothetical protein
LLAFIAFRRDYFLGVDFALDLGARETFIASSRIYPQSLPLVILMFHFNLPWINRKTVAPKTTRKLTQRQSAIARKATQDNSGKKLARLGSIVLFLVSLPSIMSAYFPRISVAQRESVREHDAMGTIFSITNGGAFDIQDVLIACGIDSLAGGRIRGFSIQMPDSKIGTIVAGNSADSACENTVVGDTVYGGTISLRVSYRPSFWPWKRGREFTMKSTQTDKGTWIWKQAGTKDFDPSKEPS